MNKDLSQEFERELVEVVVSLAAEQGINFAQFARKAYSNTYGDETAVTKWRRQRKEEDPQSVSVANAYLLAQALGIGLPDLMFRVQAKLRMEKK